MRELSVAELEASQSVFAECVARGVELCATTGELASLCVLVGEAASRIGRRFGAVGLLSVGAFAVVAREPPAVDPTASGASRRHEVLESKSGEPLRRDAVIRRLAAGLLAGRAGVGGVIGGALDDLVVELGCGRELVVAVYAAYVLVTLEAGLDPAAVIPLFAEGGWR